jgi:hypothetical protein
MQQLKDAGMTGKGCIAINLDTGIRKHNSLPDPLAVKNFTSSSQSVIDNNGHGTHTIGSILGRNGLGAAPEADLKVGKVLGDSGNGSNTVAGLLWAAEQEGDIISCSWGGGNYVDSSTQSALKEIEDSGKWLFVAAGNAGYNGASTVIAPALSPSTVCVASHNQDGSISGFSSGGARIDLCAGGGLILSAGINGPDSTSFMSGTSMATPTAAGACLLLRQAMKQLGMKTALTSRGLVAFLKSEEFLKDAGPVGRDPRFGDGITVTNQNIVAWILKKIANIVVILLIFQSVVLGQEQKQVTFQRAKSAVITPDGNQVLIFTEDLKPQKEFGVLLTPNPSVEWVEIHDDMKFPPIVQKPVEGKVMIVGKPGQLLWVSLRNSTGPPQWVKVVVKGDTIPVTPVPVPGKDFAKIRDLSKAKAALLDKPTALAIKTALTLKLDALSRQCVTGQCQTLQAAMAEVVGTINDVRKDGRYEWYWGWRDPVSVAVKAMNLTATPDYIAAMQAAAEGL